MTIRSCGVCGGDMEARGPRAKYCSTSCNQKAWYAAHRAEQIERMRVYREANPGTVVASAVAWKKANPEANRAIARRAYSKNPETAKRAARNRRAREASVEVLRFTDADWQAVLRHYGHRCAHCGASGRLTRDHVIPLALGGRHSVGNIIPACTPCNSSKRDSLLMEFRSKRRGHGRRAGHLTRA